MRSITYYNRAMDCTARQEMLDTLGVLLEDDHAAIAKALEDDLAAIYGPLPSLEETLTVIVNHAKEIGLPVTGAHYADDGRCVVLEFPVTGMIQTVKVV